jgi:exopolysaccharide biosynthesis polyprenyl glycosylphosphotransferase
MIRIFSISISASVLLLMMMDVLLIGCSYLTSAWLVPFDDAPVVSLLGDYLMFEGGIWQIGLMVFVILMGMYFSDYYSDFRPHSTANHLQQMCPILGAAFILQALLGYGRVELQMPRRIMLVGSFLVLIVIPLWRKLYSSLIQQSLPKRSLLFLGASPTAIVLMDHLQENQSLGFSVIGYLDAAPANSKGPFLGPMQDFKAIMGQKRPDEIVIGRQEGLPIQELLESQLRGTRVGSAADIYATVFSRVSTHDLHSMEMILASSPQPWSLRLQNLYSSVTALIGLIVLLPILVLVAVLVKLTSSGPVLFRQTRVGLHGVLFTLYKFRSMREDAEAQTGAVWAKRNDPRVTPVGIWLRRWRLDELPQLFNVLRGEMSLIGPRPERPEFVAVLAEQIPFYNQRHSVKPGITGWAQINHKYGDAMIDDTVVKLEYDLYYIRNLNPALDALIIFHTVKVMLLQRGAQ